MGRLNTGERIGNYLLDEWVGAGTFGEVWKGHHHVFNEPVAIKIPTDGQYVRNLQKEAIVVHGLRDANIVRAIDLDPYGDPPYLVMEFVDGPSLRGLMGQYPKGLPIESAMAVLYGLLCALDAAHRAGIIHRDIKPENILISGGADGLTPERVKVTDFGLGHVNRAAATSILQSGSISAEAGRKLAGTLAYMSPEQRDGLELDARSDLYSVGVVLHEMLTGVLPQGSDLPSTLRADLPRWVDGLFERCYTRRERRFTSADQMRGELERVWPAAASAGLARTVRRVRVARVGTDWRCAACQGVVQADDQFCTLCGAQLVDHVPRCPSCHGYVGRRDNYCILCGSALRPVGGQKAASV